MTTAITELNAAAMQIPHSKNRARPSPFPKELCMSGMLSNASAVLGNWVHTTVETTPMMPKAIQKYRLSSPYLLTNTARTELVQSETPEPARHPRPSAGSGCALSDPAGVYAVTFSQTVTWGQSAMRINVASYLLRPQQPGVRAAWGLRVDRAHRSRCLLAPHRRR
jgi:hypothetical protein